ncbi:MAG TPA: tyrosine-type recombinase/integrase [Ignavibacteriaceae bacterium]|nr:tyrosine-type recombinase/integrase [Ignavibacteriaceae bacterium]
MIKRRNGYYYIEDSSNGKSQKRISTHTKVMNEALKFIYEYSQKLDQEKHPEKLVSGFKKEYIELAKKQFSDGHISNIECVMKRFVSVFGETRYLSSFNTLELEKYLLDEYGKSAYSAHLSYKVLKAFFNRALNYDLIIKNPLSKIKIPRLPVVQPVFIDHTELQLIIDKIEITMQKHIVYFAFYTGMRQSEILTLTWEQIDFRNKMIMIRNSKTFTTKSKKDRMIPMTTGVEQLLIKLKQEYRPIKSVPTNYIFYKEYGVKWSNNYTGAIFKRGVKAANIFKDVHFHSLRHSTASNLAIKGVSLYHIAAILGHAETRTTQIYAHLQQDCLFESMSKLEL